MSSQDNPLICRSLKYIVEKSQLLGPNPDPVGIMTAMSRDDWFKVHQELLAFPDNANTLNTIQSALMIVCLDGDTSQIHPNDDGARTMAQSIHGHGSRHFSGNRWFDTTLQVNKDCDDTGTFFHIYVRRSLLVVLVRMEWPLNTLEPKL